MRLLVALVVLGCASPAHAEPRPGDLVFQESRSAQSAIIAEVTGSRWTHVGVVFDRRGELWVLEAVQPVRWTRFDRWRDRGVDGDYVFRRPRRALSVVELRALRRAGERHLGRRYDARFEWSDRRMYCSELAWKMYERALGLELVAPSRWSELDLGPGAIALARRRLGRLPPPHARVVTPAALLDSAHLFDPEASTSSTRPASTR